MRSLGPQSPHQGDPTTPRLDARTHSAETRSVSRAASQRYAQVIDITHTHLGARGAMVQPFFFCASNHSIEPGWGSLWVGCGLLRCSAASARWR